MERVSPTPRRDKARRGRSRSRCSPKRKGVKGAPSLGNPNRSAKRRRRKIVSVALPRCCLREHLRSRSSRLRLHQGPGAVGDSESDDTESDAEEEEDRSCQEVAGQGIGGQSSAGDACCQKQCEAARRRPPRKSLTGRTWWRLSWSRKRLCCATSLEKLWPKVSPKVGKLAVYSLGPGRLLAANLPARQIVSHQENDNRWYRN